MLPCRDQALKNQTLKLLEHPGLIAAHHLDKLGCQFERASLEAQITRRRRQDETKVYVDQVAVAVQQDVAVVTILHLNEIADQTVRSAALNKIFLRHAERLRGRRTELPFEVLEKRQLALLLHLMERHCVQDRLDQTAVVGQAQYSVGSTELDGVTIRCESGTLGIQLFRFTLRNCRYNSTARLRRCITLTCTAAPRAALVRPARSFATSRATARREVPA